MDLKVLYRPTPLLMLIVTLFIVAARISGYYTMDELILMMYFLGIAASLNIIMGFAGYVSFGHTVFLGIGGYIYVLLIYFYPQLNWLQRVGGGAGILVVGILAAGASALVAASIGSVVLRLRGAFFAIATIGLDFAALYIVKGVVPGLSPENFSGAQVILPHRCIVPKDTVFNAVFATFIAVMVVNYLIRRSGFGVGLMAIREDEDAAEVLGVPTARYKTMAFTISAFFTGMFGAMMALNGGGVDPRFFELSNSIDMIVMIVIGGLGTVMGPIVGGLIYYKLYDFLLITYPEYNLVIFGVIVAIVVIFAPEGIIGIFRKMRVAGVRLRDVLE